MSTKDQPEQECPSFDELGPRGQSRYRALVKAASKLFTEQGYENTTLSDLVSAAGGSRTSLYQYFGDKSGLLHAVLEEHTNDFLNKFHDVRPDRNSEPREALIRVGMRFLESLNEPGTLALVRFLITENALPEEITDTFFRQGPDVMSRRVSEYLAELAKGGKLEINDPDNAAVIFKNIIVGDLFIRQLMGVDGRQTQAELKKQVESGVDVFLNGCQVRPGA